MAITAKIDTGNALPIASSANYLQFFVLVTPAHTQDDILFICIKIKNNYQWATIPVIAPLVNV